MADEKIEMYDVVKVPDAVLKEKAHIIENIDDDIMTQAMKMVNTMYAAAGIGLAANQVNILNRMFVMDLPENSWRYDGDDNGILTIDTSYRSGEREDTPPTPNPQIFINPEVVWESEERSVYDEGCLSLPQQYGEVIRPARVRVKFQNLQGHTLEEEYAGLDSHCVQHEIDHLNGILFIDYLSTLKRNMILRRMKKMNKDAAAL